VDDQVGWVLSVQDYDSNNRVYWREIGRYLVKETADSLANDRNASILERVNRNMLNDHNAAMRITAEHNALVDAGFRDQKLPMPDQPVLKTELTHEEGKAIVDPMDWDG
jgi:hypothetical protein